MGLMSRLFPRVEVFRNLCLKKAPVPLKVQWESKEPNNQFQPYPAEINTKLEKAFNNKEQIVEWMEEEASGKIIKWTIDLNTKKETDGKMTKEVHRRIIVEKGVHQYVSLGKNILVMST